MRKVKSKIKQMFSNKIGESIKMVKVGISSKMLFYAENCKYIFLSMFLPTISNGL